MLGTPIAVPLGQPTSDILPPKKRNRNDYIARSDVDRGDPDQQRDVKTAKPKASRDQGEYIHAICGKGFQTRRAVKKHHWGSKPDNVETKTGCWAKNGKPDIAW